MVQGTAEHYYPFHIKFIPAFTTANHTVRN